MTRKRIVLVGLCAVLLTLVATLFFSSDFESREENGYRLVYEDDEKAWWFNTETVKIYQQTQEEIFLETWIRIDYKVLEMKEIAIWYFRTEAAEYKKTYNCTYNKDGYALDT